jgi:hypothetical protein
VKTVLHIKFRKQTRNIKPNEHTQIMITYETGKKTSITCNLEHRHQLKLLKGQHMAKRTLRQETLHSYRSKLIIGFSTI